MIKKRDNVYLCIESLDLTHGDADNYKQLSCQLY